MFLRDEVVSVLNFDVLWIPNLMRLLNCFFGHDNLLSVLGGSGKLSGKAHQNVWEVTCYGLASHSRGGRESAMKLLMTSLNPFILSYLPLFILLFLTD